MLYLVDDKGVYCPETVAVMATAFDRVRQFLPEPVGGNDETHQQCAWMIIRLVEQGERDPALLSELVLRDMPGRYARFTAAKGLA